LSGDADNRKCVIVLDEDLGVGLAVNTAAVLALTLGSRADSVIGPDVLDGSGVEHIGITTIPIPILRASREKIKELRDAANGSDGLLVVDFTDAAQTTTTYEAYTEKLSASEAEDLRYLGVAFYGSKRAVNRMAGSLPLLR
jgi:hypothetical protein